LNASNWKAITDTLGGFERVQELEVFLLGKQSFATEKTKFTVIDENNLASGRLVHELGGSSVQELGLMAHQLIEQSQHSRVVYLALFVDSQFFRNIAKLRAAKLLASRILELKGEKKDIRVVALTSYCEWTLYERYSNILRNDAGVASAYIGGADHVQSAGYQTL